jgi:outer membrane protein assembly factor BamB
LAVASTALAATTGNAGTLSGSVYVDVDGSGSFSLGDDVVSGAAVFFETSVVAITDASGQYVLDAPDTDGLVWVRAPNGFVPGPVFAPVGPSGADGIDLALTPHPERHAAFIHASDTHIGKNELGIDREFSFDDLASAIDQAFDPDAPPAFLAITGDLVNGANRREFEALAEGARALPLPLVPIPGNHDWYDGGDNYRAVFGPPMYSFDAFGTHFIVLNDNGRASSWQAFLGLDLGAGVEPDAPIVAFIHQPPTDAQLQVLALAGVTALFSGHWHSNMVIEHGSLTEYNSQPLLRGGADTTPAGYRLVEMTADGLQVSHHAVVVSGHADITYPTGDICAGDRIDVIAGVELGPGNVEVEVETEDGAIIRLEPAGGWAWRGEIDVGVAGGGTLRVTARRGARTVSAERRWARCDPGLDPIVGEWPQLGGGPTHRGVSSMPIEPPLATLWARTVGGHLHGGSPVVADGRVFVGISDFAAARSGAVAAFDAATGEPIWRREVGNGVRNAPAVSGDTLVFGRADGIVEAVDVATGEPRWQVDLGTGLEANHRRLQAAPTIAGDVVYIGVHRRFAAIELATGDVIWEAAPAAGVTMTSAAAAAVSGDTMVATVARGRDGAFAWNKSSADEMWRTSRAVALGVHASPVVGANLVYLANAEGDVHALSLATGEIEWSVSLVSAGNWDYAIVGTPVLAENRLFVPTQYRHLVALDASNGEVQWRIEAGESRLPVAHSSTIARSFSGSPALAGEVLWVGGVDGVLRALQPESGDELWRVDLGSPITAGLAPAGEILFVATYDGTLRAMAKRGELPDRSGCGCSEGAAGGGAPTLFLIALCAALVLRPRLRGAR